MESITKEAESSIIENMSFEQAKAINSAYCSSMRPQTVTVPTLITGNEGISTECKLQHPDYYPELDADYTIKGTGTYNALQSLREHVSRFINMGDTEAIRAIIKTLPAWTKFLKDIPTTIEKSKEAKENLSYNYSKAQGLLEMEQQVGLRVAQKQKQIASLKSELDVVNMMLENNSSELEVELLENKKANLEDSIKAAMSNQTELTVGYTE
ncbi:hypothetical protein [Endozoicomonas sp. SESOKO1]|uniref:hypothetical protein n=1 Tax=Endozoicomonas sp. SESOKO1 TaxID=2828742 RepID=UPI00214954BA|nr:hypothetical protein [Endozoicomonas sp. SESOKO1]